MLDLNFRIKCSHPFLQIKATKNHILEILRTKTREQMIIRLIGRLGPIGDILLIKACTDN
jgi:hypothetical protein